MARYTGPKTKIARKFKEPIYGPDKYFERRNYAPGQHGQSRRRSKLSEYGMQLQEKQKAKYTYGILERQFRKIFRLAASRKGESGISKADQKKGIILALCAGVIMSFFSSFVMRAMDTTNFVTPAAGKVTPYTAIVIFTLGVLASNFIFNTIAMRKPFVGEPVSYSQYFKGDCKTHLVGMLGGAIWCLGTALSYITAEKAGPAVSYALGQGAPMVAALWGVFIWKEFKGAKKGTGALLAAMFVLFVAGLASIVVAGL